MNLFFKTESEREYGVKERVTETGMAETEYGVKESVTETGMAETVLMRGMTDHLLAINNQVGYIFKNKESL